MKIFVRCTSCQKSLSVDAENEGKKARCPACGSIFEIRGQSQEASAGGQNLAGSNHPGMHAGAPMEPNPYVSGYPAQKTVLPHNSSRNDTGGWVSIALGVTGFAVGVLSYICCCFPFGFVGFGLGVGGIVAAVYAQDQTLKVTGFVLNGIAMLVSAGQIGIFGLQMFGAALG